jgi:hypothetical protein
VVVRELVERAYFALCLTLGRLLRSARYSVVRMVGDDGVPRVRKHRRLYAPLLVRLGDPLVRLLDTGVRVLPQRAWEERERQLYQRLHGAAVRIDADGTLILPRLAGETLATLLTDRTLEGTARMRAIECATVALADLHRQGITHADAMAENVLVDLDEGAARWFDFETVHDARRPLAWRRADDLRALLTTCLVRTPPAQRAATIARVRDVYADEAIVRELTASLSSIVRRPLAFHLGQAPLSLGWSREIVRLLRRAPSGQ